MRKILNKKCRASMSLGELILTVSSCSKNKREAVAAVADLIESGRVRFRSAGRVVRAHVC
jgi:hypothetical protein